MAKRTRDPNEPIGKMFRVRDFLPPPEKPVSPGVTEVPVDEAWVYQNPKVIGQIRRGLSEAKQGKLEKAEDLDVFLKKL